MREAQSVRDFRLSVDGVLDSIWSTGVDAPTADLDELKRAAIEKGWYQLGSAGAVEYLIGAVQALGRRGCPLPLADAYVAAQLFDEYSNEISEGTLRPVIVFGECNGAVVLDDAGSSNHILCLDNERARATINKFNDAEWLDGLSVPSVRSVMADAPSYSSEIPESALADSVAILRLALSARLVAAARRAHELAVEHAQERRQFGRVIGSFGAVQQRVATCHIELLASEALIEHATSSLASSHEGGGLASALAARHAFTSVKTILAGAQHTLGAIGFFNEHELPWLFRRIHTDLSYLSSGALSDRQNNGVAAQLLAGGALPSFDLGDDAESFRVEVQALLERFRSGSSDVARGVSATYDAEGLRQEMDRRSLFAANWPAEYGGRKMSVEEQVVLHEEMKYAGGPVDRAMSATMLIGNSVLRHGTEQQKDEFLPLLHAGQLAFCLGYSEPEAGSDLASLKTSAVADGDYWIINGQKVWTTRAHTASHVWLAVRTDPNAEPRHAGITIFLVPMDSPGITVQHHTALSDEVSCTVFYDNVWVHDSMRVGEINNGWNVITDALSAERVVMGGVAGSLRRNYDDLLLHIRHSITLGSDIDALDRDRISWLGCRLQSARALVLDATKAMNNENGGRLEGSVAAVLSGDLAEELSRTCLDILGPKANLASAYETALRGAPMYVIGGGTNDIQRGIIARSLGLPRE